MSSNEILTLQFGHYSNFISAHWWNIQESGFKYDIKNPSEINHDVLFREGLTLSGEVTFTPRCLLVDLKGSLRNLPLEGDLYKVWSDEQPDNVEVHHLEEKYEPNAFQKDLAEGSYLPSKSYDFDSEVRVWSDFLYTRFHPRTTNIVNNYQHCNEQNDFNIYPLGMNLWNTFQFKEDFTDKIRLFIEECNSFQGFHTILNATDGFAGLASSCLEYLQDEYTSKSILAFPAIECESKDPFHVMNLALCYDSLGEFSNLFVPLVQPRQTSQYLNFNPELQYQSSSILASALDTTTLVYRLKKAKHSLIDICSLFSSNGRKAAAASVCLPFPLRKHEYLIDCLDNFEGSLFQSISPNAEIKLDSSSHLLSLRGVPESRLKKPVQVAKKQRDLPAYRCDTVQEMLQFYMSCTSFGSRSQVVASHEPMPVSNTFPKTIFKTAITENGDVDEGSMNVGVEKVNILSGLHTGSFVGEMFDVLSQEMDKLKYKRFHQFVAEGFEHDQIKESFERLLDLKDCYDDNNYFI